MQMNGTTIWKTQGSPKGEGRHRQTQADTGTDIGQVLKRRADAG